MLLLDTNVVSELRKVQHPRTAPEFVAWARTADHESFYLPSIVLYEMEEGLLRLERRDPAQALPIRMWMIGAFLPSFRSRVLPLTAEICMEAAKISVNAQGGNDIDFLIAATARVHGMTLVTRNTRHFEETGILLLNPWETVAGGQ